MVVQTTRFGKVQCEDSDLLSFPEGILGFNDLKTFVLLDDPTDDIFAWLQSCDNAAIAFPVLEPELFTTQYKVMLAKTDLEVLKLKDQTGFRLFSIITIPDDPTQMTANLKAPVVVNIKEKIARQCVLQDNGLAIKEPIFAKLQQRVVQNPNQSIKEQFSGLDVAVKIEPHTAPAKDLEL